MGEDVGHSVRILHFGETDVRVYAVVEAVEVQEVDWLWFVVL